MRGSCGGGYVIDGLVVTGLAGIAWLLPHDVRGWLEICGGGVVGSGLLGSRCEAGAIPNCLPYL